MTTSQRMFLPFEQLFTNLGIIGAGWKIYTYDTLTTTPKATYTTQALNVANSNPVEADAYGRVPSMFVSRTNLYKAVLTDENDVVIATRDPVDSLTFTLDDFDPIPAAYWGTTAGTSAAYTLDSNVDISVSGYSATQIFLVTFHTACVAAPTLSVDGLTALNLKKYTGVGTKLALEIGDVQNQRYWATNDGTDIVILNPEHPANFPANTTTWRGLTHLPSQITIANNVSDANNDIDFSAGVFQFSDGSGQAVATALTKRLDAIWAAGTNQGGLDTGSKANNTYYYCYAIANISTIPTTADFLFSTSPTSPVLPSGYTKFKRIKGGAIKTDGSGNILGFSMPGIDGMVIFTPTRTVATSSSAGTPTTITNIFPAFAVEGLLALTIGLNNNGHSDLTVWGNLQSTPSDATQASSIGTNNSFSTSGTGIIFASNGSVTYENFTFAGGVTTNPISAMGFRDLTN